MKNHKGIYLRLHEHNDAYAIKRLEGVSNKNGYIKSLINRDDSIYKNYEKGEKGDSSDPAERRM